MRQYARTESSCGRLRVAIDSTQPRGHAHAAIDFMPRRLDHIVRPVVVVIDTSMSARELAAAVPAIAAMIVRAKSEVTLITQDVVAGAPELIASRVMALTQADMSIDDALERAVCLVCHGDTTGADKAATMPVLVLCSQQRPSARSVRRCADIAMRMRMAVYAVGNPEISRIALASAGGVFYPDMNGIDAIADQLCNSEAVLIVEAHPGTRIARIDGAWCLTEEVVPLKTYRVFVGGLRSEITLQLSLRSGGVVHRDLVTVTMACPDDVTDDDTAIASSRDVDRSSTGARATISTSTVEQNEQFTNAIRALYYENRIRRLLYEGVFANDLSSIVAAVGVSQHMSAETQNALVWFAGRFVKGASWNDLYETLARL